MGLDVPDLDDRTYDELVERARDRVQVHTSAWTDHNASDPGITMLETLAWLTETYIYQLDRTDDRHLRRYLHLLGVTPRNPQPASVTLDVAAGPSLVGEAVPAGTPLSAEDPSLTVHAFETAAPVTLTDASVVRVVSEYDAGRRDVSAENATEEMYFLAFGPEAPVGAAMYLGFDADPFGSADTLDLWVDFRAEGLPDPASHGEEPSTFEPSVEVRWEYCTAYDDWFDDENWVAFDARDETSSLYRGGRVSLARPDAWNPRPAAILELETPLRWVRCVVAEPEDSTDVGRSCVDAAAAPDVGADVPTPSGAAVSEGRGPDPGYEVPPRLEGVRTNVVPARNERRVDSETLGRTDGGTETTARPGQSFLFEHRPVLSADVEVEAPETGEVTSWATVPDFDSSGSDDRDVVLDGQAGRLTFGDNVAGAVPPAGHVVTAAYVHVGGAEGNVPRDATWWFEDGDLARVAVAAREDATGGADAESPRDALARLRRDRRTPYRCVTRSDFEFVATNTPGLRFGRAAAFVETETVRDCGDFRRVRVVVVPFATRDRPRPSAGFLDAVRRHVCHHALLTDRVVVEGATYVGVGVRATVRLESGYAAAERTAAVSDALDEFLDPLEGYDGSGWPFGRPLYRSELFEVIDRVPGVDCALDVSLDVDGPHTRDADGTIRVDPSALFDPGDHDVSVRRDRESCDSRRRRR